MEGDKTADNDKELTSTSTSVMGKLLSTNKEEKSDSNDTLPTSSTDASTSIKSTHSVSDDPISSTSSEMELSKSKLTDNSTTSVIDKTSTNFDTDAELLGMSITTDSSEKIEENVDDLVNDLETLLGESTDSFNTSSRPIETKNKKAEVTSAIQEELANFLGENPEDEVSSNTGTTSVKVDSYEDATNAAIFDEFDGLDKLDEECVADKSQKSLDNLNTLETAPTNLDLPDLSESTSDTENKNHKPENICLENDVSRVEHNIENKEIEHTEDNSKESTENVDNTERNMTKDIAQGLDDEVKDVEELEVSSQEAKGEKLEQQGPAEYDQASEEAFKVVEDTDRSKEIHTSAAASEAVGSLQVEIETNQESSNEHQECLSNDNKLENQSAYSAEEHEKEDNEQDKNLNVLLETNTIEGPQDSDQIGEKTEETVGGCQNLEVEEVFKGAALIPEQDKVQDQETEVLEEVSCDNPLVDDNNLIESQQSSTSGVPECAEKVDFSEDIEKNSSEVDNIIGHDNKEEQKEELQKVAEESAELNKEDFSVVDNEEEPQQEHQMDSEQSDESKLSKEDVNDVDNKEKPEQKHYADSEESAESNKQDVNDVENKEKPEQKHHTDLEESAESNKQDVNDVDNKEKPEQEHHMDPEESAESNKQDVNDVDNPETHQVEDVQGIFKVGEEDVELGCNPSDSLNEGSCLETDIKTSQCGGDIRKIGAGNQEDCLESVKSTSVTTEIQESYREQTTEEVSCGDTKKAETETVENLSGDKSDDLHQSIQYQNTTVSKEIIDKQVVEDTKDTNLEEIEVPQDTSESKPVEESLEAPEASEPQVQEELEKKENSPKPVKESLEAPDASKPQAQEELEKEENSPKPVLEETEISELADGTAEETYNVEIIEANPVIEELADGTAEETDNTETIEANPVIEELAVETAEETDNTETIEANPVIEELADGTAEETDNAESIGASPVIEEPEEPVQSSESVEQHSQSDNIEENVDEKDVEEHSSDADELGDMEVVDEAMADEDVNTEESDHLGQEVAQLNEAEIAHPTQLKELIGDVDTLAEEPVTVDEESDKLVSSEQVCSLEDVASDVNDPETNIVESKQTEDDTSVEDGQVDKKGVEDLQQEKSTEPEDQAKIPEEETLDSADVTIAPEPLNATVDTPECEKSEIFKDIVQKIPSPSNSKEIEDQIPIDSKTGALAHEKGSIEVVKPLPEINIRRKTVEQDLEKVVCLSEESSDSDSNEPVTNLPKLTQEEPSYDEETDLIKIAAEVEQFPDTELSCEENMPAIEEILSVQPQQISTETLVESSSNLETILAVASLQNESVSEVREDRRLSEKEIREMEAIRMAVASITDSSQDTHDSYLIENSVTLDNSLQDISNDAQEFASGGSEVYDEPLVPAETIVEENTLFDSNCAEAPEEILIEKMEILPENVNKTEDDVCKIVSPEEVSNSSQKETITDDSLNRNIVGDQLDEKIMSVDDNVEKIESVPSTDTSGVIDNVESQGNDEINEPPSVASFKETFEDSKAPEITEDSEEDSNVQTASKKAFEDSKTPEILANSEKDSSVQIASSKKAFEDPKTPEISLDSEKEGNVQKAFEDSKAPEITEHSEKDSSVLISEQKVVENVERTVPKEVLQNEVISANPKEDDVSTPEEIAKENVPVDEVSSKENITNVNKEDEVLPISKESDTSLVQEVAEEGKPPQSPEPVNAAKLPKEPAEEKDINVPEETAEEKRIPAPVEERPLRSRTRRGNKVSEPLSINVEEVDKKEKVYSPKITIKPVKVPDEEVSTTSDAEGNKGSLKITITKQSDKLHSILKVFNPEEDALETPQGHEEPIPKLIIKPKMQQVEQHSPKMTTRSSKAYSPTSTRCSSPRVTIKPVTKPTETKCESVGPLKITFKPVVKPEEGAKRHSPKAFKEQDPKNHNPKITIKPIPKPLEVEKDESSTCTPKVTIKPLKRHIEENEADNEQERSSPKITIKPLVKPVEQDSEQLLSSPTAPKLKIKPIKKHDDEEVERDQGSPKISIKPIVKPPELEEEEEIKERIVLKINKGNLPSPSKDLKKREYQEDDKSEKVGIKLKFSTTGGHTHIIQEEGNKRQRKDSGYSGGLAKKEVEELSHKRSFEEKLPEKNKKLRTAVTPDKLGKDSHDNLKVIEAKIGSPVPLSEDSRSQHSVDGVIPEDSSPAGAADISKIADIASRTTYIESTPVLTVGVATPTVVSAPKRRGRPRKVPLKIREELGDAPAVESPSPQTTPVASVSTTPTSNAGTPEATPSPGGRPKRSCRGQNVIATLGIKPRKPRGRGRGSKVNMGDRQPPVVQVPVEPEQTVAMKPEKEPKLSKAKLKLMQKVAEQEAQKQKEALLSKLKAEEATSKSIQKKEEVVEKKGETQEVQLNKEKAENAQIQTTPEEQKAKPLQKGEISQAKDRGEKLVEEIPKKEEAARKQPEDNAEKQKSVILGLNKGGPEEHTPPKKKKDEKTPPRKLEVTTRRQKAQQQKEAEDAEKVLAAEGLKSPKKTLTVPVLSASQSTSSGAQKKIQPPIESVNTETAPSTSAIIASAEEEIITLSTDEDSCGKESVLDQEKEKNVSNLKSSPPKRPAEKLEENIVEEKRAKIEVQRSSVQEVESKQQTDASDVKIEDDSNVDEDKEDAKEEAFEEDGEGKKEDEEDEPDSGEDSEAERRREWVLQKKQEAIKKCRAKRMEKLARAAELKRKRQEQAAQQREARKAAEEAEKAAGEKGRATKRYGRYGIPKPQISLVDAPVQETAGTIKSPMGLFVPETESVNVTQPILIDDDNNSEKEQSVPLKHLEELEKSPQKVSAPEPMVVDSVDESHTKIRRSIGTEDVVMLDEETRMSADFRGSSRAQTPAKQAIIPPPDIMVEDSQGSVGTEGGKSRSSKTPKMEVFQDLESTVFTADQLAEYSWNGQGPFMLQEQVAQYLGIKSFKRKYPQITRRPVDMQERDYLKENGLATEAQCDLGLTAVSSQDILDIMYSDFQDKYEDYCRCQREKQARELASKQKALSQFSLKPGFDKLDILEQAVQSAAAWNQQFNKARKEQRKAHMDLQSFTVHYPKSKMKVIPTPKIGHYPVALVPGQFTDYYKDFTPTELNNLPLNTMCYDEIKVPGMETESEGSSSGSDSDSESSSGSSGSGSTCDEVDCKECVKIKTQVNGTRETDSADDVVIIENDASSSDSVVLVSVTAAPVTA